MNNPVNAPTLAVVLRSNKKDRKEAIGNRKGPKRNSVKADDYGFI